MSIGFDPNRPTTMRQLRVLRENRITPTCPACGEPAKLTVTEYGPRHDCCGLTSWAHKPLADRETLDARQAAHAAFDPIWKSGAMSRSAAYRWLSEQTGIPVKQCHMALMDRGQALRVVEICKAVPA